MSLSLNKPAVVYKQTWGKHFWDKLEKHFESTAYASSGLLSSIHTTISMLQVWFLLYVSIVIQYVIFTEYETQ